MARAWKSVSNYLRKYIALIEKYMPLRSIDSKKLDTRDRIKWFKQKIKEAMKQKYHIHAQVRADSASVVPKLKVKLNKAIRGNL